MYPSISTLVFIDSTGYNYADFPAFLAWTQGLFQSIYGPDIYLGSDSQDGQFAGILAQAFYDTATLGADIYNSFSPATAQGVGLSRLVLINGLERESASFSTAQLVIIGVEGTTLSGSIAIDTNQNQWSIPDTTIPSGGTITVTGTCTTIGAITALPNTINGIFTPTNGWQSVNNPDAATVGEPVELDSTLRVRQSQSTANPSSTVFEGTVGAVGNVPGVTAFKGYENPTGSTDGNGLPPHSIAIVVQGGDETAIARAIQIHKTPGTETDGTTSVALTDSQGMPITINFYYATVAEIGVQVTVSELAGWDDDTETLIQNAVSTYVSALPIGNIIILTQLYAIAYLIGTPQYGTFNITSIELEKNGGGYSSANITLDFNEIPVCVPGDVVIVT